MPKLWTLDAMRGVAAVAVAALHFNLFSSHVSSPYLAVDLFFALSGFVIGYAYDARLSDGMGFREFAVRRMIRLYPLYLLGLTLGLLIALLQQVSGNEQGVTALPFLQFICALAFVPFPPVGAVELVSPLNGPYWSLILEIHINIILVLAFRWLSIRVLATLVALFAVVLAGIAWSFGELEVGFRTVEYHLGAVRIGFSFFMGLLLWRMSRRIRLPKVHWAFVLAATAVLLSIPTPPTVRWAYDAFCVIVLFPVLVLLAAASSPNGPRLQRMFATIGGASYALYAIHMPLQVLLQRSSEKLPEILVPAWQVLFLLIVCSTAVTLDWTYDRPIRRWLTSRFAAPAQPPPSSRALKGEGRG